MSPETVFSLANAAVLPAWLALAASPPGAAWTRWTWLLAGRVLPLALAVPYALLLAWHWPAGGGYGSLAAVRTLFEAPGALVAGWLHYLAFDLFVGTWIARRAGELGVHHILVVPMLALTFLFGPVGLLAFFALRAARRAPAIEPTSGVSR
jgi:hypothetical protein